MLRTTIIGAAGRMGRSLVAQALTDPELSLAGAVEAAGCPQLGQDAGTLAGLPPCGVALDMDLARALASADAVIDFSSPECTMSVAPAVIDHGASLVVGTTGLTEEHRCRLRALGSTGRIVLAPNMSVGINLLFALCAQVAPLLGPEYDIEIVEMHHNRKKDAPSGTALRLGEILATARGLEFSAAVRHGREGNVGARQRNEIGIHALRGGDVVCDHTVVFAADGERVELVHKASSRETFAKGAVRAVKFLAGAAPGLYDMQDVLGLK